MKEYSTICKRCEQKEGCTAMCAEACVAEIKRIERKKQLNKKMNQIIEEISNCENEREDYEWAVTNISD